ncbi:MAG: class I SAM-dependent methyltransferase [Actinobacteria bacterium]|nr:class I SAM-dependent methyltransferase [Actinomycetota bacterium]
MPDAIFGEPRLAQIYDLVEGERDDLDHYVAMAAEFGAGSVLDVGCGTGTFACLLADRGVEVVGVDPAAASLDIARAKPGAQRVQWVLGDAASLPELQVDLATMTGNVAQVFLTDEEWSVTLRGVHTALRPGGHLVFEVRDPARQAWLDWNRETTYARLGVPGVGTVETWLDVTDASGCYVTWRRTYVFAADGATLTSVSTRRFRSRAEIQDSLRSAGYTLADVRDAPDRPGREWVFIARKPS